MIEHRAVHGALKAENHIVPANAWMEYFEVKMIDFLPVPGLRQAEYGLPVSEGLQIENG